MRQGDSGQISLEDLPTDHTYLIYMSIYNEETGRIVKEISTVSNNVDGTAIFSFVPGTTDNVPVGDYVYGIKMCYEGEEHTLVPEVTIEDGTVIEQPAPSFVIAEKIVEGPSDAD